jgi:hypothetical protein
MNVGMGDDKRPRLSAARATLAEYGLDVSGIDDVEELLRAFQPLKEVYKSQPGGRAEIYANVIRPALLVVRSHLQQIHPQAFGEQVSKVGIKPPE